MSVGCLSRVWWWLRWTSLFSRETGSFWNKLHSFLSCFLPPVISHSLPPLFPIPLFSLFSFAFLYFSSLFFWRHIDSLIWVLLFFFFLRNVVSLLLWIFQTLREREVEGRARQKKATFTQIQKGNREALALFEQVAEDTDNREGVL